VRSGIRFLSRAIGVVAAALLLSALFSQTTLYSRVAWWFEDSLQRRLGPTLPLDHVVIFDVDEESMQYLQPSLGAWPYSRDVYARAARYLSEQGARVVVFDILFSEPRKGDDALARALDRRSVLAAAALPGSLQRSAEYHDRLKRAALFDASADPGRAARSQTWGDLTLPLAKFTETSHARIGVISVTADEDGVVRRLPLLHRASGEVLPSTTLATLLAAGELPVTSARELRLGGRAWRLAPDGSLLLRYPRNAGALSVVPFYQLVAATNGARDTAHIPDLVRDKIVFVGSSSAVLGDFAYTPVGRMPGLELNALFTELLLEGQVRSPDLWWLNVLLLALAVAVPLRIVRRGNSAELRDFVVGLAFVAAVVPAVGIGLFVANQDARWVFATLTGAAALACASVMWLLGLLQERQRLFYEKLAAQEASRMKSEFLNHMTHELRTPITAIMGFNKINQLTDDLGREQRMRNAMIVARNCEHLLALVNNNLDLARIEAGQLAIERSAEDPRALLDDVLSTIRVMADEKALALRLMIEAPMPAALSLDAFRLRQVLLNLLGNAVKFTSEGEVVVEARYDGKSLGLTVRDTGAGIPAEVLPRVFEAFQRGTATRGSGTGLGLTITHKLVELMGGTIEVTSAPGRGTTFSIRIPAAQAAPVEAEAAPTRAVAPTHSETSVGPLSGTVLVAEDNEHLRMLVELSMRQLGVSCRSVGNGFDAVEAALAGNFDLLLMDINMPVMDGHQAVRVLRERGYQGAIVAFTAYDEAPELDRVRNEGFDDVVTKAVTVDRLRRVLQPFLGAEAHRSRRRPEAVAEAPAPSEEISVKVDRMFEDLLPDFLSKCRSSVKQIHAAVESNDLPAASAIGHSLRGSGGSYGFDEITAIGGEIERASRKGDANATRGLADRLERYLARVRPVFE
jgi:signal transduction histidine kinase/CheY-like chemotaxis protein/HPt (histidine-containing phosphotransfer) domain-containing protein